MKKITYWQRVLDYRYDPFFTVLGKPIPPKFLPWLFPTTRIWIYAFYFALTPFCKNLYRTTHSLNEINFH